MNIPNLVKLFFESGLSTVFIYFLIKNAGPLIAAIAVASPIKLLFVINSLHNDKKSNEYIANYLETQTFAFVLTMIWLYANAYFIKNAKKEDSIYIPILKGTGIWFVSAIIYYFGYKTYKNK
jgi:hypothetical protein